MNKRDAKITKERAIALVREKISPSMKGLGLKSEMLINEEHIDETWWAWIVPCCTREYKETKNPEAVLLGLGPYLVDKFTGEVIPTGSAFPLKRIERERGYRSWWKFG